MGVEYWGDGLIKKREAMCSIPPRRFAELPGQLRAHFHNFTCTRAARRLVVIAAMKA